MPLGKVFIHLYGRWLGETLSSMLENLLNHSFFINI